jgi:hypothetical protein
MLFEELENTKKLYEQRKKGSTTNTLESFVKTNSNTLEESTNKLMEKKIELLNEIVNTLKEGFLYKKICDISKHIRTVLCDYICKLSKKFFVELFDMEMIEKFPFFLIDSNIGIKSKYLGLIYEKMENNEDNDSTITKKVIDILKVARDAILNICIKEEKNLAKQGIKIIELLSQHKLLEIKTVHSMLPHLFNPEPTIRLLISKIVLNYILNFKDRNAKMDVEEEHTEEITYVYTIENLIEVCEFFFKLSNNEEKLVKVLVDNFYKNLKIFDDFGLFFNLIDYFLNYNNEDVEENLYPLNFNSTILLRTCVIMLNISIDKVQSEIENNINTEKITANELLIPKNENFINFFLNSIPGFIQKTRILCKDVLVDLLGLFSKFKIYNQNLIKFNESNILDLISVLKSSFFITVKLEEGSIESFEKSVEGIVKAISKLMANKELIMLNTNYSQICERLIYGQLSNEFKICLDKEILSKDFYKRGVSHNQTGLNINNVYIVLTQLNHLIIHFKNIIQALDYTKLFNFMFGLFSNYVIPHLAESELYEKLGLLILTLSDTFHYIYFNEALEDSVNSFVVYRQHFIDFLLSLIKCDTFYYEKENFEFNSIILRLKTKSLCILLELFIYITSDKLDSLNKYNIEDGVVQIIQDFISKSFLYFFTEFNSKRNDYISDFFENELELKTECYKQICEKFSRLLLLNLGIFKYTSLCCIYFEAFYIIKLPVIFENLNSFVFENLLDKEIAHYIKTKNSSLNIVIFFVTKVTMRLFTKKAILEAENAERLIITYMKHMKKMKTKYKEQDIVSKDKAFLENFIINSINFALGSRIQVEELNHENISIQKIEIENITFLEVLQTYLRYTLFFDENDFKNILMIFLKLSKEVELIENVKRMDTRVLDRFKSFLLNKAKMFVVNEGNDDNEESKEKLDNEEGKESQMDIDEEPIPKTAPKKKAVSSTNKKAKARKKNEIADEEDSYQTTKKKKKN